MENQRSIYSNQVLVSSNRNDIKPPCRETINAVETNTTFRQIHVSKHCLPVILYPIETAQKWLQLPGKDGKIHKFPLQTILPKVQMTRQVPPRQLPRDVEVDRRRRQYERVNLIDNLDAAGLGEKELMPTESQYYNYDHTTFKHFLPISFFDDSDYDCNSPDAWMRLGIIDGEYFPVPAKAYLPVEGRPFEHRWQYAAIQKYDNTRNLWTAMNLIDECVYEVPKIQLMFLAESPTIFVERLLKAVNDRNTSEKLIMMDAIVDCVLLQDLKDNRFIPNKKIDKLLLSIKSKTDEQFFNIIRTEVYLVFEHLMACYEFDKFVKLLPREFPAFNAELIKMALPKAFSSEFSDVERQNIKVLKLDMKMNRYNVLKTTMYYIGSGIEAMGMVVVECQYIETLSLFVCSFAKPLPLSDFLQSQQQHSTNVAAYLKEFWPQKLSMGICMVLRALGKGWLDISLDKWSVYQMCKISRFILEVKLRMQESMQVLLEKSILNFSYFLTDPSKQFLSLELDYKWTSDFIQTEFPYPKPIFSLIIGITEDERVVYSTAPEEFQPALVEVFKKALEKTSGVRCIDAETLTNLRFAKNLYILTVELIEDMYIKFNDLIDRCYSKAVIPLHAYSKIYERFIPFYLLKVNDFIKDYENAKKSSLQVKLDILEFKRQKEEIRQILPATITIGPFQIVVDPLKQFMIRKYIEIVKRLFEYYVQRMYEVNERILEECQEVYTKISDRPQSIEHLYEICDFVAIVPDRVEELRADIQIMWLEYDMLDSFFYNLSDMQFAMKWEAYAWPHIILQRLLTLRDEQKNDIDEFKRIHLSECIGFEERLESLNEEIQAFSLVFDPNKVVETAVDVKKTWRIITDLQKLGHILKYRQTLFELGEFSLEFLDSIIDGFAPYRNLWGTCSDFVKLEEATIGNPLTNIELDDVWTAIQEIRASLERSQMVFNEKVEVQGVANTFLERVLDFIPVYNCIKWIKNENWIFVHWQELAQRSGIDFKYSVSINFHYLMRKGIMNHLNLVKEISEKAENEADELRRQFLEEERRQREADEALLMRKALRKCRTDIV